MDPGTTVGTSFGALFTFLPYLFLIWGYGALIVGTGVFDCLHSGNHVEKFYGIVEVISGLLFFVNSLNIESTIRTIIAIIASMMLLSALRLMESLSKRKRPTPLSVLLGIAGLLLLSQLKDYYSLFLA